MNHLNEKEKKRYRLIGISAVLIVLFCVAIYFCFSRYTGLATILGKIFRILRPVIYGVVIAYLLTPVYNFLYCHIGKHTGRWKHGALFSKVLSIIISVLFALFIVYAFFALLIPALFGSIRDFILSIPAYAKNVQGMLQAFLENNPEIESAVLSSYNDAYASLEDWLYASVIPSMNSLESIITWLKTNVVPHLPMVITSVSTVIKSIVIFIKDVVVGLMVAVYILATKESLAAQAKKITYALLPENAANFLIREVRHDNRIFGGFITGKILDSFIIAVITFVVLTVMKMPYTLIITIVIGMTNIIPFFGPFIGAIPSIILVCLVDPLKAVYFSIYILAVQQFDGNILGPKILGGKVGLPGLWVIVAVLFFGGMFGFVGMVIGVPVAAILYSMIRRFTNYRLQKIDYPTDTSYYQTPGTVTPPERKADDAAAAAETAGEKETV